MTHPTTTLPADETSPTSPAPAPGWGNPTTPNPQWGWQQPPSPPTPPAPIARKRPGWARRNLTTLLAGAALAVSVFGLVLPLDQDVAPTAAVQGPMGPAGPQGPQGERGPAGKAGKNGKDGANGQDGAVAEAPAPEAAAPEAPATEAPSGGEFSDGTYKVGVDIQPGEYRGTVDDGNGYWARLDKSQEIIDNQWDTKTGASMYFTVKDSDAYVEISGATFHKV
jgi:hypothetical protein